MSILLGAWILPAPAHAETPPDTLSPGDGATLSIGVTAGGIGLAALAMHERQFGLGLVLGGATLLLGPSVGRVAAGGQHAELWITSRLVIGAIGAGITLAEIDARRGQEYGPLAAFVVGSLATTAAVFADGVADIISTTQIGRERAFAVAPTLLGRAPGLALAGTF